ncbi:MAG: 30S ribosomal protein S16 [Gemmatimonadaceae bacterium]|nr:30S ribosomal protein S16 [Gemmatimonadaceae bacterium]
MAVRIRLRRTGRRNSPSYRIVVVDGRAPRQGAYIEAIGQYTPRAGHDALNLKADRASHWLDKGAQPSDTVRSLLRRAGVLKARHEARLAKKLAGAAVPLAESPAADAAPAAE